VVEKYKTLLNRCLNWMKRKACLWGKDAIPETGYGGGYAPVEITKFDFTYTIHLGESRIKLQWRMYKEEA
jgi:hypothetical protein